jgi:Ca2+-binding EF-hand superfamily protein
MEINPINLIIEELNESDEPTGPNEPNKLNELKEIFNLFDVDDDGYITYTEFYSVLKALNKHFTETQIRESFHNLSTNSKISFDAFINIMERSTPANDFTEEDLACAFNVFDIHNNGYITVNDLHIIMKKLGDNITMEETCEMFQEINLANNGKISYEEFKNSMLY